MSTKALVSIFARREEAEAAAARLVQAGLAGADVSLRSSGEEGAAGMGETADYAAPILPDRGVLPAVPVAGMAGPVLGTPGTDDLASDIGQASAVSDEAAARETGDLAAWLASEGVPEADARSYAERVRAGGTLLLARCDEGQVSQALRVLDQGTGGPALAR